MEWISPTQHRDPQGEWSYPYGSAKYRPENAYNDSLEDMAMALGLTPEQNFEKYGDYWSGWLEMYPKRPIDCSKVRLNYHKSNHYGRTSIQIKRLGQDWETIFFDLPVFHTPYWHEISFYSQSYIPRTNHIVEGVRLSFERPQNLSGKIICFDVYDADFYGELTDLPEINPPPDPVEPTGKVEIMDVMWKDERYHGIWRPLEKVSANQGILQIIVTWQNLTNQPIKGEVDVLLRHNNGADYLKYLQGNDAVVYPGEAKAVMFELPIVDITPENQGEWELDCTLDWDKYIYHYEHSFMVGTPYIPPPIPDVAVWEFPFAGYFPRCMPGGDYEVELKSLEGVPSEVQGVYYMDADPRQFWGNGAPGNTLQSLKGGECYGITTTGACTWEIPLGEVISNGWTKETLRPKLESGEVAEDWWEMPNETRIQLATKITQWFSVEEFGEPKYIAYNGAKPTHDPRLGHSDSLEAHCASESGLRYALIGGQHQPEDNLWYYTKQHGEYEWRKAKQEKPFGLPCAVATVNWTQNGRPYGHIVCALQVGIVGDKLEDWVFFQFQDSDIKVGDAQMQTPGNCQVKEVQGFISYAIPKMESWNMGEWEY